MAAPPPVRPIGVVLHPRRHSAHERAAAAEPGARRHSAPGDAPDNAEPPSAAVQWEKRARLYKTEICRTFEETGACRYGARCQFAHTPDELRPTPRHPRYKTEVCRTYWELGTCPYGKRCCFIHDERGAASQTGEPFPAIDLCAPVYIQPRVPAPIAAAWPAPPACDAAARTPLSLRSAYIARAAHISDSPRASPDPVAMGVLRFLDE